MNTPTKNRSASAARLAAGVALLALSVALSACSGNSPVAPEASAIAPMSGSANLRSTDKTVQTEEGGRKKSGYLVSGGRSAE